MALPLSTLSLFRSRFSTCSFSIFALMSVAERSKSRSGSFSTSSPTLLLSLLNSSLYMIMTALLFSNSRFLMSSSYETSRFWGVGLRCLEYSPYIIRATYSFSSFRSPRSFSCYSLISLTDIELYSVYFSRSDVRSTKEGGLCDVSIELFSGRLGSRLPFWVAYSWDKVLWAATPYSSVASAAICSHRLDCYFPFQFARCCSVPRLSWMYIILVNGLTKSNNLYWRYRKDSD